MWRTGRERAESRAVVTEILRDDMLWWRQMLNDRRSKKLHYGREGVSARHPRLPLARQRALSRGQDAVCAVYAEASGSRGLGASVGDA